MSENETIFNYDEVRNADTKSNWISMHFLELIFFLFDVDISFDWGSVQNFMQQLDVRI